MLSDQTPETSTSPRAAAVLWDLDGTLIDTEPDWIEAEFELIGEHGGTWDQEHALKLVGNNLLVSGRYIRDVTGIPLQPEEIVDELIDRVLVKMADKVRWRPGAHELLLELRSAGVRCALVTMSYQRIATPIIDALPEGTFEVVVTGDEVDQGKPHPEPYLKAAAILGVDPGATLAIEDSSTGVESAAAAGCTVLVVQNHVAVPPGERRVFADTLAGMRVADLPVPDGVVGG